MSSVPDAAPATREAAPPARVGMGALARLAIHVGRELMRSRHDVGARVCAWAHSTEGDQGGAHGLRVSLGRLRVDLVTDPGRSRTILSREPGADFGAGRMKVRAMRFLAPGALTIADGDAWARLREFNEQALGTGGMHPLAQEFLTHVRRSFSRPVSGRADVEAAMARVMAAVVVGGEAKSARQAAEDVTRLFNAVQHPVRRLLLGWWYARRRTRLYDTLRRRWRDAPPDEPTLLAQARRHASTLDHRTLLEQIPHWMFTFTGSGTDLLTRTLALVGSRPDVAERVAAECAEAGPADQADTVERLRFTRACALEAGRLFPPVTRTFHRPMRAARAEVVHYFPLLQRDDALGASVHRFVPERWLEPVLDEPAEASNLFLRGPRACPGRDLILFVCTAAIARQVGEIGLRTPGQGLSRDPLPVSFPEGEARFAAPEVPQ